MPRLQFRKHIYNCPKCKREVFVVHEAFIGWTCAYCNHIDPLVTAFKPLLEKLTSRDTTEPQHVMTLFKMVKVALTDIPISDIANCVVRYKQQLREKFPTRDSLINMVKGFTGGNEAHAKQIVAKFNKKFQQGLKHHHKEEQANFREWLEDDDSKPSSLPLPKAAEDEEEVEAKAEEALPLPKAEEDEEQVDNLSVDLSNILDFNEDDPLADLLGLDITDADSNQNILTPFENICHRVTKKEDSCIVGLREEHDKYLVPICDDAAPNSAGNNDKNALGNNDNNSDGNTTSSKGMMVNEITHCPKCGAVRRVLDRCGDETGGERQVVRVDSRRYLYISVDQLRPNDISVCNCKAVLNKEKGTFRQIRVLYGGGGGGVSVSNDTTTTTGGSRSRVWSIDTRQLSEKKRGQRRIRAPTTTTGKKGSQKMILHAQAAP